MRQRPASASILAGGTFAAAYVRFLVSDMGDGVDAPYGIYVPRWWC